MMGNVNTTIKTNVRQVEETYQSVLNIQRSMVQLNQMFMDLAYLVNEQGESIDRIEMNVGIDNWWLMSRSPRHLPV